MSCCCQDKWIGQSNDPVLCSVDIHLCWSAQNSDGRDEAAGNGHGGGEQGHLLGGQQVLGGGVLTSPRKEDSDESGEHQCGRQHEVLLPAKLL